ncbi:hypothetical protein chiPu_0011365 [Chiloscyllium punctatum]|uniref:Uncharacterized protein n=1 Tax=Chiloscyllium punctatum TaxID=137246 RepID=A0A401SR80_CHIPU|nr:hypothetical protein [Chiloscyllium punctatum]
MDIRIDGRKCQTEKTFSSSLGQAILFRTSQLRTSGHRKSGKYKVVRRAEPGADRNGGQDIRVPTEEPLTKLALHDTRQEEELREMIYLYM